MADVRYINSFGLAVRADDSAAQPRERHFWVLKKDNMLLCHYDVFSGLYSFPDASLVDVNASPLYSFILHEYVRENGEYFRETQIYDVIEVDDVDLDTDILCWCKIDDILINKIKFSAEQKNGFKNLLVRGRNA